MTIDKGWLEQKFGGHYNEQCDVRWGKADKAGGIEALNWLWPKTDEGGWDGPLHNWNYDHSTKWFTHLKDKKVAVQAGGSCGMYPRMLAQQFELVYTFEPSPVSFYCLVNNCQSDNIIKINAALGAGPGRGTMSWCGSNVGSNTLAKDGVGKTLIMRLDALELHACDLLALDVEGQELDVIIGAQETIKKYNPVIVAERGERQELVKFLSDLGYQVSERSAMDTVFWK